MEWSTREDQCQTIYGCHTLNSLKFQKALESTIPHAAFSVSGGHLTWVDLKRWKVVQTNVMIRCYSSRKHFKDPLFDSHRPQSLMCFYEAVWVCFHIVGFAFYFVPLKLKWN